MKEKVNFKKNFRLKLFCKKFLKVFQNKTFIKFEIYFKLIKIWFTGKDFNFPSEKNLESKNIFNLFLFISTRSEISLHIVL